MTSLPDPPSFGLGSRRALVCGASSGIGLGCAVALADAGAKVTLAARNKSNLERTANEFLAKGWKVEVLPLDIADIDATEKAVERSGPYDVLVNSAGIARHALSVETSVDDFDVVMGVNLRGAFFLTRAVAKGLIKAGKSGSLINISSQMGYVGGVERAVYCA